MQAKSKGANPIEIGIIIGSTPLGMVLVSPLTGFLVSHN